LGFFHDQLKNKAINKTEGFVNNKANTFLNAFGAGRSEVSIGGLCPAIFSVGVGVGVKVLKEVS
jgi:hypothetical protein